MALLAWAGGEPFHLDDGHKIPAAEKLGVNLPRADGGGEPLAADAEKGGGLFDGEGWGGDGGLGHGLGLGGGLDINQPSRRAVV